MTKQSNTLKFHKNEHLMQLIANGAHAYKMDENQYVEFLIKKTLYEFEERIEHENPSKVLAHCKDAMDFFKFDDVDFDTVELERQTALVLKLTCKEYQKDLLETTTMFICYSILRD